MIIKLSNSSISSYYIDANGTFVGVLSEDVAYTTFRVCYEYSKDNAELGPTSWMGQIHWLIVLIILIYSF